MAAEESQVNNLSLTVPSQLIESYCKIHLRVIPVHDKSLKAGYRKTADKVHQELEGRSQAPLREDAMRLLSNLTSESSSPLMDFQGEWDRALACLIARQKTTSKEEWMQILSTIAHVVEVFTDHVKTLAVAIFDQYYAMEKDKDIKVFGAGGIAGGQKYKLGRIFVKTPDESQKLYSSYEEAAKAAGHDLRAMNHFLQPDLRDGYNLHLPLMVQVDFRGFRLVAMAKLPLSEESLQLGSPDALRSISFSDTAVSQLKRITDQLGLRPHTVTCNEPGCQGHIIPGPFDLEVHLVDGTLYVLDTSRLFPPLFIGPHPPPGARMAHCIRSEYTEERTGEALSSDDPPIKSPIEEATKDIQKRAEMLPMVLLGLWCSPYHQSLGDILHRRGINIRFLGFVHEGLLQEDKDSAWCSLAMAEIVARAFCKLLAEKLRQRKKAGLDSEEDDKRVVKDMLNRLLILDPSKFKECNHFWHKLKDCCKQKFPRSKKWKPVQQELFKPRWVAPVILQKICKKMGIIFHEEIWTELMDEDHPMNRRSSSITRDDIKEIIPVVKQPYVTYKAKGLLALAKLKEWSLAEKTERFPFETALEAVNNLREAIHMLPKDGQCLRSLALSYQYLWRRAIQAKVQLPPYDLAMRSTLDEQIQEYEEVILFMFDEAWAVDHHPDTMYLKACFFHQRMRGKDQEEALRLYNGAIANSEKNSITHAYACAMKCSLIILLFRDKSPSTLQQMQNSLQEALSVSNDPTVAMHLALVLALSGRTGDIQRVGRLLLDIEQHVRKSSGRHIPPRYVYDNLENFARVVLRDDELANKFHQISEMIMRLS